MRTKHAHFFYMSAQDLSPAQVLSGCIATLIGARKTTDWLLPRETVSQ